MVVLLATLSWAWGLFLLPFLCYLLCPAGTCFLTELAFVAAVQFPSICLLV